MSADWSRKTVRRRRPAVCGTGSAYAHGHAAHPAHQPFFSSSRMTADRSRSRRSARGWRPPAPARAAHRRVPACGDKDQWY